MKTLHNFNVNALQDQEMEWVVGGGDPESDSETEEKFEDKFPIL